jgi:DNA invertase Pin-like site-specific DNA recombinase
MKTVIYCRVSTDQQTTDPQELELRKYAEEKKWEVVEVITDVISGAKSSRVGLDRLMLKVRGERIDAVMVVKIDRLARSLSHFAQIIDELRKHRVALIVPGQGIDTSNSNPAGRMMMNMLGVIADFERELIAERTKAGMAVAKARGKMIGRNSPTLVENWREIIVAWRLEPYHMRSYAQLAKLLNVAQSSAWRLEKAYPPTATCEQYMGDQPVVPAQ